LRHDKAAMVIDLARGMAASAEGLTLNEMAAQLNVGRRTAERMRDAVLMLFPQVEEVSDPPTKRWRIRGGLSAFEQAPTATEMLELTKVAAALRAAGEPARAAALESLERKVKAAMRSTTLNRMAPDLEALVRAETIAVQAGPRPSADETVLAEIRGAVLAERPLNFIYARPGAEARTRTMTPCGLMFGRANYLVAADRDSGRIQTFRLDRMSAVEAGGGGGRPPAGRRPYRARGGGRGARLALAPDPDDRGSGRRLGRGAIPRLGHARTGLASVHLGRAGDHPGARAAEDGDGRGAWGGGPRPRTGVKLRKP